MDKILIIEDDISLNMVFEIRLIEAGFLVDIAETGKEGIEKAMTNQYRLILLDYNLPDINGVEVYNSLKKDPAFNKIPVIFVSAIDKEQLEKIAKDVGADGYISLPFGSKQLVDKVKEILKGEKHA